jgi:hypothetical protein
LGHPQEENPKENMLDAINAPKVSPSEALGWRLSSKIIVLLPRGILINIAR